MRLIAITFLLASSAAVAVPPVNPKGEPPKAVARPVTETMFGTAVTDRYRYMESKDAETVAWMKAQGAYARHVLDSIGPRKALADRIAAFGSQFGVISVAKVAGERLFYTERAPGADVFSLGVLEGGRKRLLIDTAVLIKAGGGVPHAIDWFEPSHDGSKVAVGISTGGSEDSKMTVIDTATGKTVAGPIDRMQFGGVDWTEAGDGLFLVRLQTLGPAAKPTDKYRNLTAEYWNLNGEPKALLGPTIAGGPITDTDEGGQIAQIPHSDDVLLVGFTGVVNETRAWWGKGSDIRAGTAKWTPVFDYKDGITRLAATAKTLFLLSHDNAPRFKVLSMPVGGKLGEAKTVIAARDDQLIEGIAAAADGLYVQARRGMFSVLMKVANDGEVSEIALPYKGSIDRIATDVDKPGAVVAMSGWTQPPGHFHYDPAAGKLSDMGLEIHPVIDPKKYAAIALEARAKDGTMVPLTVIGPAGPVKPRPMLLDAYGAYGVPAFPYFGIRWLPQIDAGVSRADCAVRGGGEFGEAWRLAGKGTTKPNSWRDFIACAETLIAKGYTTPALLTITGTSAGGITVGRAATERPDLFAGAIPRVADVNTLRAEFMPGGPANIPEFGTITQEQGFKDLLAMDTVQAVKDGVRYPAFLITAGLNDPRVEPWTGAKLAARLQELPGHQPILFRLEVEAGHGLGTTKTTRDAEEADIAAFVLWRAGVPEWQPRP